MKCKLWWCVDHIIFLPRFLRYPQPFISAGWLEGKTNTLSHAVGRRHCLCKTKSPVRGCYLTCEIVSIQPGLRIFHQYFSHARLALDVYTCISYYIHIIIIFMCQANCSKMHWQSRLFIFVLNSPVNTWTVKQKMKLLMSMASLSRFDLGIIQNIRIIWVTI